MIKKKNTGARRAGSQSQDDPQSATPASEERQREEYGGINWGAAFFGWLVAIAVTVLLSSIVGAIAAAVGAEANVSQSEAQRQAGTIGIVAAAVLLAVLLIGYYAGGYVAGRMSRFDGGKQGLAVWLIGLIVTILTALVGAIFGSQYNILQRVSLPSIPVPTESLSWGGLITAVVLIVGTLLGAMAGGKVGQRYHAKVDRAANR
jgi:amino acid transporter